MRGECWIRPPPPICTEGGAGTATAAWMLRTVINTAAGRLPLLNQRPAHPEILTPLGTIARHPSRLPNGVRLSDGRPRFIAPWRRGAARLAVVIAISVDKTLW